MIRAGAVRLHFRVPHAPVTRARPPWLVVSAAEVVSGAALLVPPNIADDVTAPAASSSHAGRVYYLP